ncbi:MAG TPA: GNAT family N-acetyltransferase [Terriglobales bacterium]|jgi:putative acetyltransferase
MFQIVHGDLHDPRVVELLHTHLVTARAATAPGSAHALDLRGLESPSISFWTIWEGQALLGCGALKQLSSDHGEVKSMHVVHTTRRQGAGTAMLRHIIKIAQERGMTRLSLETGASDYFVPAREFYKSHGFQECQPFSDYVLDPNSVFMSLALREV